MEFYKLRFTFISSLFLCMTFFTSNAIGDITSQISDKVLNLQKSPQTYSFIVSGHTYGAPSLSMYPAASLLANIQLLNKLNPDFMMLLGDVIQHQGYPEGLGELETEIFKRSLVDKLEFPVFNSPGNHDVVNRNLYEKSFGKTYFHFQKSAELYIVLDTQSGSDSLDKTQIDYVLNLLKLAAEDKEIKNIFIFHHTIFWTNIYPLNTIKQLVNGRGSESNIFDITLLPALNLLAKEKNVYLLGGDIGLPNYEVNKYPPESFSIFFQKHNNITYIANGLAENENDAVIKVDISSNGDVDFQLISLIGIELGNIEKYDLEYWQNELTKKETVEPSMKSKIKEKIKYFLLSHFSLFILGSIFFMFSAFIYILFLRYRLTKK